MIIIQKKFKKVADFCYKLFQIAELPIYYSKFSNKIYSNFQKLFLLVYKQFRKFTYEELLTDLEDNVNVKAYLGFRKLPHYTTLSRFAQNLPSKILDKLILAFKKIIPNPQKVAIDATGISLDNASPHYCKRIGKTVKKRPFMKTTFIVDIETYIILLCKMRKGHRHDTKDAKPLIKKLAKHYKPEQLYADRGYDDEKIFKEVFENLGAYPFILQKNMHLPSHKKKGEYRKTTIKFFDYGEYLQRNKIETTNSMFKKRFASNVKSKTTKNQKVEVLLRIVAFNIDRMIRLGKSVILLYIRITRIAY